MGTFILTILCAILFIGLYTITRKIDRYYMAVIFFLSGMLVGAAVYIYFISQTPCWECIIK